MNILYGKTIFLVNTGNKSKLFILKKLKSLGINIVCIDKEIKQFAKNYINNWILYNIFEDLIPKIEYFLKNNKVDGILTFWEDDVLLTAKLVDKFNFIGNSYNTTLNIRNKFIFKNKLNQFKNTFIKPILLNSETNLNNIDYPCVIKPSFGASSAYVIYVDNKDDLIKKISFIKENISTNIESALNDGLDIFIDKFLKGDEIDIDLIVQNGIIKFFSITDNYPSLKPYMMELGQEIPSKYYINLEDRINIFEKTKNIIEFFKVENGCYHFEAKYDNKDLYPIEINMRMGGDEVYYFIKETFGIDLIEDSLKVSLGINIENKLNCRIKKYLIGEYIIPNKTGILQELNFDKNIVDKFYQSIKVGQKIDTPPFGFDFLGWYIIKSKNKNDLDEKLKLFKSSLNYKIT